VCASQIGFLLVASAGPENNGSVSAFEFKVIVGFLFSFLKKKKMLYPSQNSLLDPERKTGKSVLLFPLESTTIEFD